MGSRIAVLIVIVTLTGCSGGPVPVVNSVASATASSLKASQADAVRVAAANARSEQAAEHEAVRLLSSMPSPAGSRKVPGSEVPPLTQTGTFLSGSDISLNAVGFWLVPNHDAHAVADWYTLHPPAGMNSDAHAIGGSRNPDGSSSYDVFYNGNPAGVDPDSAAVIEVASVGSQVGVRIGVYTSWRPARPMNSFARMNISAMLIEVSTNSSTRVVTVRDAASIRKLSRAYDALLGTQGFVHSCPMEMHPIDYRLTFVSPTGQVVASFHDSCNPIWIVTVDGAPVEPALQSTDRFKALVATLAR